MWVDPEKINVDGEVFELGYKEALYLGSRKSESYIRKSLMLPPNLLSFISIQLPAHKTFPDKKITKADALVMELGSLETANTPSNNQ
jgi:4-deoxy-L-threo-5-hexosulose-uronate ketol-isomerase